MISYMVFAIIIYGSYFAYKQFNRLPSPAHFIALPSDFKSYGIDVSHYQGTVDWENVLSDSLISFVYCKATEGTDLIDAKWQFNREKLLEKGIPHGAYHFYIPSTSAKQQAIHFLNNYQKERDDLPPVLDVETESGSADSYIENIKIWLTTVEQSTGRRPIIYTSYNIYSKLLKAHFKQYKFWVANYSQKEYRFKDEEIIIWQYSDNGSVAGIKGKVDLNFSKIIY